MDKKAAQEHIEVGRLIALGFEQQLAERGIVEDINLLKEAARIGTVKNLFKRKPKTPDVPKPATLKETADKAWNATKEMGSTAKKTGTEKWNNMSTAGKAGVVGTAALGTAGAGALAFNKKASEGGSLSDLIAE